MYLVSCFLDHISNTLLVKIKLSLLYRALFRSSIAGMTYTYMIKAFTVKAYQINTFVSFYFVRQ